MKILLTSKKLLWGSNPYTTQIMFESLNTNESFPHAFDCLLIASKATAPTAAL